MTDKAAAADWRSLVSRALNEAPSVADLRRLRGYLEEKIKEREAAEERPLVVREYAVRFEIGHTVQAVTRDGANRAKDRMAARIETAIRRAIPELARANVEAGPAEESSP